MLTNMLASPLQRDEKFYCCVVKTLHRYFLNLRLIIGVHAQHDAVSCSTIGLFPP